MKRKYITGGIILIMCLLIVFITYNWDNFYRIQKVEIREIQCSYISNLLDSIYIKDQRIRTSEVPFKEFVQVDHENLEIVVSIMENCGMPTLKEVNQTQLLAIWVVLQHSIEPKYTKKYFPQIVKSVLNGDLSKQYYALMKDRILMDEGEPQIFGSQIKNDKLYNLQDPECVNFRREAMGMKPIEQYLKQFNIDFNVTQNARNCVLPQINID